MSATASSTLANRHSSGHNWSAPGKSCTTGNAPTAIASPMFNPKLSYIDVDSSTPLSAYQEGISAISPSNRTTPPRPKEPMKRLIYRVVRRSVKAPATCTTIARIGAVQSIRDLQQQHRILFRLQMTNPGDQVPIGCPGPKRSMSMPLGMMSGRRWRAIDGLLVNRNP